METHRKLCASFKRRAYKKGNTLSSGKELSTILIVNQSHYLVKVIYYSLIDDRTHEN